MNVGFGARAELRARRLASANVVVFEIGSAAEALAEAVERRRAGQDFAVSLVIDDHFTAVAAMLAPQFLGAQPDYDGRRGYFDALAHNALKVNDVALRDVALTDQAHLVTAAAVLRMAPRAVAASWAEYYRLGNALGTWPASVTVESPRAPATPLPQFDRTGPVVVWAPDQPPDHLLLWAFALELLHAPVTIVAAAAATIAGLRARVVAAGSIDVPDRACCIVDASTTDAAWALAFASGSDAGLAVASTSGALEYVTGAVAYDPHNHRSIADAVARARGTERPRLAGTAAAPSPIVNAPLVSVYVPTHNRRDLLPAALDSLAAQSYANLEIIVVNDAGIDVGDIVARYPNARLIAHDQNRGPAATKTTGAAAARGSFVLGLDDDDVFFPDHIEALVRAALRSGAPVTHSDAVRAYYERRDDRWVPYGYEVVDVTHLDRTDLSFASRFLTHQLMYRRDAFQHFHPYVDLPAAEDYDLWLSLAEFGDWTHVAAPTALYSVRSDKTSTTTRIGNKYLDAHLAVFARHPRDGRPAIAAARERTLALIRAAGREPEREPPLRLPAR